MDDHGRGALAGLEHGVDEASTAGRMGVHHLNGVFTQRCRGRGAAAGDWALQPRPTTDILNAANHLEATEFADLPPDSRGRC
jgi:hypothetical protein